MVQGLLTRRAAVAGGFAALLMNGEAGARMALTPRNLAGVWQGGVRAGGYFISGEVIFRPNGTYRRMHTFGDLRHWTTGPFSIVQNWIHFEVDDYGPQYYLGVYQYPPPTETWVVSSFDGREIEGTIGDTALFSYRRVG